MLTLLILSLSVLSPPAQALEPLSVDHQGAWSPGALHWTTTIELDRVAGGELRFARPLPNGTLMEADGASILTDEKGALVGLDVAIRRRSVVLHTEQPMTDLNSPEERLLLPIPEGAALQRLQVDDLAFEADPSTGIEARVGYAAQRSVKLRDRIRLDRTLGHHRARYAAYFTGDGALSATDLRGDLHPAGEVSSGTMGFTGAVFLGLVGLLIVAQQLIARRGRAEVLDRYIREEFVRPTPPAAPGG